jgi:hypothetical protein
MNAVSMIPLHCAIYFNPFEDIFFMKNTHNSLEGPGFAGWSLKLDRRIRR